MMKTMILAIIASMVLAGQAQALSCMRPDVARTFAWASQAEESYIILHGSFAFTQPEKRDPGNPAPDSVQVPSTFNGRYLGADGFTDAPPLDILLEFQCVSAWCGSMMDGDEVVAFVQQSDEGYRLNVDPCYSTTFDPTRETVRRVTSCMRGTGCDEAPF